MNEEKKLALLIDSDNVSAKYAQFILQEASKYGELTYKRVYGDWGKNNTNWRTPAIESSILAVQQTSYIAGKNVTDFSMIIDAMDIMYTGNVDGFVLVTSDSDFTRLAIRLREAGMLVVGIGEDKTPVAFKSSCHHFICLNRDTTAEVKDSKKKEPERSAPRITSQLFVMEVQKYASDNMPDGGNLGQLNNMLLEKYGKSYVSEIGFSDFSAAVASVPGVSISKNFIKENKPESANKKSKAAGKPAETASKPDINSVKRDIFEFIEKNENAAPLGPLGQLLTEKYGKGYLKKLGFTTMKKLTSSINGVTVKDNNLSFSKNFLKRAKKVEQFVYDFARSNESLSIKSLSSKLKAQFEGFDLADYGYSKYSDFINAIDGVRANGYYVEAVD